MGIGTRPVNTASKTVSLVISFDSGTLGPRGNPILNRVRVNGVKANAAFEDLYDLAYTYSMLVSKPITDIFINENTSLSPID